MGFNINDWTKDPKKLKSLVAKKKAWRQNKTGNKKETRRHGHVFEQTRLDDFVE